jgi:hypothetical protein
MGISSDGSEQGTKLLVCCLIIRTGLGREGQELGCDPVSDGLRCRGCSFQSRCDRFDVETLCTLIVRKLLNTPQRARRCPINDCVMVAARSPRRRNMPSSFINDPEHWRARAREMRALASLAHDEEARAAMLKVADDYENLARRAERRTDGGGFSGS